MVKKWMKQHGRVINDALTYINNASCEFILKGGTALLSCYNLDRFSEDIDLDGLPSGKEKIETIINGFCKGNNYTYRVAKDTDFVKRYMVNYGNNQHPLKVETSFRRGQIDKREVDVINGINVYKINALCAMKTAAYQGRDRVRDLYDLAFICNNYYEDISKETKELLINALTYKGIEQFDYILQNEPDELIDEGRLATMFLEMFDRLGLLYNDNEKGTIKYYESVPKDNRMSKDEVEKNGKEEADKLNSKRNTNSKKEEAQL